MITIKKHLNCNKLYSFVRKFVRKSIWTIIPGSSQPPEFNNKNKNTKIKNDPRNPNNYFFNRRPSFTFLTAFNYYLMFFFPTTFMFGSPFLRLRERYTQNNWKIDFARAPVHQTILLLVLLYPWAFKAQ